MPTPAKSGAQSEHIAQLIKELSAECELLCQQNVALSCENRELRHFKSTTMVSESSEMGGYQLAELKSRWSHPVVEDGPPGRLYSPSSVEPYNGNFEPYSGNAKPLVATPNASRATNNDRISMGTSVGKQSNEKKESRVEASKSNKVKGKRNLFFGRQRATSIYAPTPLEEFHRLDVKNSGSLTMEDLVRIMQSADIQFEYGSLVNVVRALNNFEPDSYQTDLFLDVAAYGRLMDENFPIDTLSSETLSCLRCLRHACNLAVSNWDVADRFLPEPQTKESLRAYTEFWLETIPTFVILVNTAVTGLSADHPGLPLWDYFEYVFLGFYTIEFILKVTLHGAHPFFCGAQMWWNAFDTLCLFISWAETILDTIGAMQGHGGAVMLIKIFRLFRLARLVRTLRFRIFYELKLMVMGVFSGLRVLTWAIVMFMVLIYVVGVAMVYLVRDQHEMQKQEDICPEPCDIPEQKRLREFASVGTSMFTLFRCWTEGCAAYDGTPLPERLRVHLGPAFVVCNILMSMFVTVGVFNLIMAVFIDNVVNAQMNRRKKEMVVKSDDIEFKFRCLFLSFLMRGVSGRKLSQSAFTRKHPYRRSLNREWEKLRAEEVTISRELFGEWLESEHFTNLLEEAEIETNHATELFEVLDADMTGELSLDELTTGLMKLRGPVTKSDIVAVRLKVRHLTKFNCNLSPNGVNHSMSQQLKLVPTGLPNSPPVLRETMWS